MKFKLNDKVKIVTDCLRFFGGEFTYGYIDDISSRNYRVRSFSGNSYCWVNDGEIKLCNNAAELVGPDKMIQEDSDRGSYEEIIVDENTEKPEPGTENQGEHGHKGYCWGLYMKCVVFSGDISKIESKINYWFEKHSNVIVEKVTQSSAISTFSGYHEVCITVWYKDMR